MDILFLITSFIFALIVPIINYSLLGLKGIIYSVILILFILFVLAYSILSIFKFKIARIDYLLSKKIVSWNAKTDNIKPQKTPFYIALFIGIVFGIVFSINSFNIISNILLSLSIAFACLGWWLMGIKRLEEKYKNIDSFVLSHVGLILGRKSTVFNGYSNGILSVKNDNKKLVINILQRKKEHSIVIDIPEDKIATVDAFILDLNEFLNG
ncbi:MAG: hypothetical protein E7365_00630 [Clostridiales bacterium]|nr:hypothetical protein [Clostridiales bacterium]